MTRSRAVILGASITAALVAACAQVTVVPLDDGEDHDAVVTEAGSDATVELVDGGPLGNAPLDADLDAGADTAVDAAVFVAPPTFAPAAGTLDDLTCVTLGAIDGGTIHFTLDGSPPTEGSPIVTGPIAVGYVTITINAVTVVDGNASAIASATYDVGDAEAGAPRVIEYSPSAGSYDASVDVHLGYPSKHSTICYTVNGATPHCVGGSFSCAADAAIQESSYCSDGILYDGGAIPITADAGVSVSLRALGCAAGEGSSPVAAQSYSF